MPVFISWSENLSKNLAEVFKKWLKDSFDIETYFSEKNIEPGAAWFSDMSKNLEKSRICLSFLTEENLKNPWMFFESGAIFKGSNDSSVCPILFGVERSKIKGTPYDCFQSFSFSKTEILSLIFLLNNGKKKNKLNDKILANIFKTNWKKLEKAINSVLSENKEKSNSNSNINFTRPFDSDYANNNKNLKYLYEDVIFKRIALVASNSEAQITITDYYPKQDCFRIETSISSIIHNMYKNERVSDSLDISVCPDKIKNPPVDSLGGITSIKLSKGDSITHDMNSEIRLLGDHEKELDFTVDPNSKIDYELKFWILNKSDDKYYTFFQRFSESASVTVTNKLKNLDIVIKHETNETLIKPNKALKIYNGAILPEQNVTFLIMKPRKSITTIQ